MILRKQMKLRNLYWILAAVFGIGSAPSSAIAQNSSPPAVLLKKLNAVSLTTRPALGDDGCFYANGGGGVLAFDSTTLNVIWGPISPCGNFGGPGVSVGANGLVYAVGDNNECGNGPLDAFRPNGSIVWGYANGSPFPRQTPALDDQSSTVFFGSSTIEALDYNTHSSKWTSADGLYIGARGIGIDANGNLYVGTHSGEGGNTRILSFSPTGAVRWQRTFPSPDFFAGLWTSRRTVASPRTSLRQPHRSML